MTNSLALSNLSLFETTKEEREQFAINIMEAINEGLLDPLHLHLQLKCAEDLIKAVKDQEGYSNTLEAEASKYGKRFEKFNAKFEIKGGVPTYDWAVCNDEILNDLLIQQEMIKEKLKERQTFLKNIPASGVSVIIEGTGEVVTVYPPAKSQKDIIAVTLK